MKVAIQLFGHLRTYDKCYQRLFECLGKLYDCDIFIHTWDTVDHNTQTWHNHKVKKNLSKDEIKQQLIECYAPKRFKIDHQNVKDEGVVIAQDKAISIFGIKSMLYSMREANGLREEYEKKNGTRYDYVVMLRPDVELWFPLRLEEFIQNTLPKDLENSFYFGGFFKYKNLLNDWRAIGGSDVLFFAPGNVMSKIFSNFNDLVDTCIIQEYSVYGPEYSFIHAIQNMGITLQFINYLWDEKYTVLRGSEPQFKKTTVVKVKQKKPKVKKWYQKIFRIHLRTYKLELQFLIMLPFNILEWDINFSHFCSIYISIGKRYKGSI